MRHGIINPLAICQFHEISENIFFCCFNDNSLVNQSSQQNINNKLIMLHCGISEVTVSMLKVEHCRCLPPCCTYSPTPLCDYLHINQQWTYVDPTFTLIISHMTQRHKEGISSLNCVKKLLLICFC